MSKKIKDFKIICYSFMLIYAVLIVVNGYVGTSDATFFHSHSTVLAILYTILFLGSWSVLTYKEWGRRLLVGVNIIMIFYFIILWLRYPMNINTGTPVLAKIALSFIAAMYFLQDSVKYQIKRDWKNLRKSILVVDDDYSFQRTIKRILLPSGYSVLTATTGERGLQIARTQKPDLVILDVILPGIKGRALCSKLKDDPATRDIPVIFLTAKDSPDDIDAEISAGAIAHLTKPVNSKLLREELKKIFS